MRIAIIEDSKVLRDMLSEMLQSLEHVEVGVLADGESSALELMAKNPVDLAIVDLELKEGNGLGVIKALKETPEVYGSPKAVVFSNYAVSSMSRRCRHLGASEIFDKSFQLSNLINYIKKESQAA